MPFARVLQDWSEEDLKYIMDANVMKVFLTPRSCRTLANGILCVADTKGPFHIFSIFMMLASK
jgi:hypothetical protein